MSKQYLNFGDFPVNFINSWKIPIQVTEILFIHGLLVIVQVNLVAN